MTKQPKDAFHANVQRQRIGFLKARIEVPDDFAEMGRDQIIRMFEDPEVHETTKRTNKKHKMC